MSYENPASFLIDINGNELAVSQSQVLDISGTQPGIIMAGSGSDGIVRMFKVAPTGEMFVTGTITATVTQTPNLPVSQGNPGGISDAWNVKITDGTNVLGTNANPIWSTGSFSINNFPVTQTVNGTVNIGNFPVTQSVKIDESIVLPVSISNFPAVQIVTGTIYTIPSGIQTITGSVTVNGPQGTPSDPVWISGSVYATQESNASATATLVSSSATTVTILAANDNRRAAIIFNDSTKRCYLKLGSGASISSYTFKMSAQGYWEVPGFYTGIITGFWESANGFAAVTEILD